MSFKSWVSSDAVAAYVNQFMLHDTPVKQKLREETARLPMGQMQISPDQGAFLALLIKISNTRRALEVGTFTGYSALCVAEALPPDGKLVCCDISEEFTSVARRYWAQTSFANRIELRLGPAAETLQKMIAAKETFDFAFIDADKEAYDTYYEAALKLLRPGSMIVMDNMLGNRSEDPTKHDPATTKMHPLNQKIKNDSRVEALIVTIGAGFMLARKK